VSGSAFSRGPFGRGPYSDATPGQTPAPLLTGSRMRAYASVSRQAAVAPIMGVGVVLLTAHTLWEIEAQDCSAWTPIGGGLGSPVSTAGGMFPSAAG
jgi:hypothetical protein